MLPPPHEFVTYLVSGAFICLGIFTLGMYIYLAILGKNVTEAIFYIDTSRIRRGEMVKIEVQHGLKTSLTVEKAVVGLMVRESHEEEVRGPIPGTKSSKTKVITTTIYEDYFTGLENMQVPAKETLSISTDIVIPSEIPASTPPGISLMGSSSYRWNFVYRLIIRNSPDFISKYPVTVR